MEAKQIAFLIFMTLALGLFGYTVNRLAGFFGLTKKGFKVDRIPERIKTTLLVAFGQSKILRRPVVGAMHALVWWGFLVVTVGTAEMVFDGILGTERILGFLGPVYTLLMASGDIFAFIIITMISAFLIRRHVMHIKRFSGVEMTTKSNVDATIALFFIMFLMVSLIGMNMGYVADMTAKGETIHGYYPISQTLVAAVGTLGVDTHLFHEINWWIHIVLVFSFMNMLPYSKHFHVFMSVPNVFLTDMKPMTQLHNMPEVTKEVELMMNPDLAFAPPAEDAAPPARFGVKDVEDISWKNYTDSLTCTECGRCTSVCPANITGKLLSPRKIMKNTRQRMSEAGPGKVKDKAYDDGKSLIHDYITTEELWACTTCNACVQECPVNIDQVSMIIDLRRYLVMEEAQAPASWNSMFSNIENNGAPWQFSPEDRFNWANDLQMNVV